MKLSPVAIFIIGVLTGLMVTFVIDPLDPSTASSPFCLALVIMILSLREGPWLVASLSLVYAPLTVCSLLQVHYYYHHSPHPYFWFFQRVGLFFLVCCMGVYLSYYRLTTQRNLARFQDILSKLPVPVVISDATGCVTYANEALCTFFGLPHSDLLGKRYVDLFMTDIQEGKAMRYYIELFEGDAESLHELELSTSALPTKTPACLTCLGSGSNRTMTTVLQP